MIVSALKVFVIGCGRSGTHWLGHSLASHPEFCVDIERPPAFGLVRSMAWNPQLVPSLLPELVSIYNERAAAAPRHFADKSHPNLYLVDQLATQFPEARFVAIRRKIGATTASMLRHEGVLRHFAVLDQEPSPNAFLGVCDIEEYKALPVLERCVQRIIASSLEIERLSSRNDILCVDYEAMHVDSERISALLAKFLGVANLFNIPRPPPDTTEKWRRELTIEQRDRIAAFARQRTAERFLESLMP